MGNKQKKISDQQLGELIKQLDLRYANRSLGYRLYRLNKDVGLKISKENFDKIRESIYKTPIEERAESLRVEDNKRLISQLLKDRARTDIIIDSLKEAIKPVDIIPHRIKLKHGKGDEETAFLEISDTQIGRITRTYNPKVFASRMEYLTNKVMKIVSIHREDHPIRKLVIAINGDIPDGEGIFPTQAMHIDQGVLNQVYRIGVPAFGQMLIAFSQFFNEVDVIVTRGNHGRTGKFADETSNWDIVFGESLRLYMQGYKNITWYIADKDFYVIKKIYDWSILVTHGHQIKAWMNIPWYGIERRVPRWDKSLGSFHFAFLAHFHSIGEFDLNGIGTHINGTFMSDDDYAKEFLGLSSSIKQWLVFFHPKQGETARYQLRLDRHDL